MTAPTNKPQNDTRQQTSNAEQGAQQGGDRSSTPRQDQLQGEGNYDAARKFDEAERKFVESGKVDAAARAAAPRSEAEQQEMLDAERKGKSRAKEEDPAIKRPATGGSTPGSADSRKR